MITTKPHAVKVVESSPMTITTILISIAHVGGDAIISNNYTPDPSGTTICPIGTDGFIGNALEAGVLTPGQQVDILITEKHGDSWGPVQTAPDGPFTIEPVPDGAELIQVLV